MHYRLLTVTLAIGATLACEARDDYDQNLGERDLELQDDQEIVVDQPYDNRGDEPYGEIGEDGLAGVDQDGVASIDAGNWEGFDSEWGDVDLAIDANDRAAAQSKLQEMHRDLTEEWSEFQGAAEQVGEDLQPRLDQLDRQIEALGTATEEEWNEAVNSLETGFRDLDNDINRR